MDLTNFKIADCFRDIECENQNYDLHNDYDFVSLNYDIRSKVVTMSWEKSNGDWVPSDIPKYISLISSDVYILKCKERDSDIPFTEDDCLSSMGFIHNKLIDEVEGFSYTEPNPDANHLNLSFMSGFAVKIAAGKAEFSVEQ